MIIYTTVFLLGFLLGWIYRSHKPLPFQMSVAERNAYEWEIAELKDALEEAKEKEE
jgi:hypothetical protein